MALVAKEALYIGTARAHNPGDVVDAERVERFGWGDLVEERKVGEPSAPKEPVETTPKTGTTGSK